jgi:membrane protease YdiL (CAAX protease family)
MSLFRNNRENRPRAFWRLLFQTALYSAGITILGSLLFTAFTLSRKVSLGSRTVESLATSPYFLAANGVASLAATIISIWLAGRFFDLRPLSGFGMRLKDRNWWFDLGFGLSLGALLMTGIFFLELSAGWIEVTDTFETAGGGSFLPAILAPAILFLCVGIYEEMISRGYHLTNLAEGLNYPSLGPRGAILLAWILSSSIFGVVHLANPGATLVSTVNIAFAGLLLGTGYVLTGRLAIPIGLHITWNFFQGNVFGFPVSGLEPIGATFLTIEQGGPLLFTGGAFGPEAGLLDIAAALVGSLLIWLWARARYGKANVQPSIAEPPAGVAEPTQGDSPNAPAPETRA